jgi:hypothetical protein
MGVSNIIHGYILTWHEEMEFNQKQLSTFEFDEVWPLPAIFNLPNISIHPPVISFAMAYYGAGEDWDEWMSRFEKLLGSLHAFTAEVIWNRDGGEIITIAYFFSNDTSILGYKPPGQNRWIKHITYNYEEEYGYQQRNEQIEEYITI